MSTLSASRSWRRSLSRLTTPTTPSLTCWRKQPQPQQRCEGFPDMLKVMLSYNLSKYDGTPNPVVFRNWTMEMEKGFDLVRCPEIKKVKLASFFLVGDAELWWRTVKEVQVSTGWKNFVEDLRKHFILPCFKRENELEFMRVEQTEGMSVREYTVKFDALAKFVPSYMAMEGWSAVHYWEGLLYGIRRRIAGYSTMAELREQALEIEILERQEAEAQRFLSRNSRNNLGNSRILRSSSSGLKVSRQGQISKSSAGRHSYYERRICGRNHQGRSYEAKVSYFQCGNGDQRINGCPVPKVISSIGASGSGSSNTAQRCRGIYAIGTKEVGTSKKFEGKVTLGSFCSM